MLTLEVDVIMNNDVRIGNDIEVTWVFYTESNGSKYPYNFNNKNLSLYVSGENFRKRKINHYTRTSNSVKWMYYGKDQTDLGVYALELIINEGIEEMVTIDACNAFTLVNHYCDAIDPIDSGVGFTAIYIESVINEKNPSPIQPDPTVPIIIDSELSLESENPVQNKVVTKAIVGLSTRMDVINTQFEELGSMVDELLHPTEKPTFTAPSASLALKGYASIQEVGAAAPTEGNFSTLFNAGQIMLGGEKQNDRAGALDTDKSFIYYGDNVSNVVLPTEVAEGNTSYKYRAVYAEGPQPVDNNGNNYATPLAAGYVDSSAVTVNGTWPWYASTANASAENPVVKQSLVSWSSILGAMSTGKFTVQPSGTLPQVFKLPRPLVALQMLNTISGQMNTIGTTDYTESTEVINGRTYYVYTYDGAARGSVTLLAKF